MQISRYKKRAENSFAESTLNSKTSALRNLREFTNNEEPTPEDVEEWIEHLIIQNDKGDIKSSTIREYFNAVRSYFRIVNGSDNELEHISEWLPKSDVDHGDYLDREEWYKIRNTASSPRTKTFIELMYFYARRPGEVLLVNLEDIDFNDQTILFNILKARKRSNATVTVNNETKEVLRATFELHDNVAKILNNYINTFRAPSTEYIKVNGERMEVQPLFSTGRGRLSYSSIYNSIKKIADKADIQKNITPKSFRHTRSTHLDWEGHDPGEIARQQLVHSPRTGTNVVEGYIHEREVEQVREPLTTEDEQ